MKTPRLSVVIATHNRVESVRRLVGQLTGQAFPLHSFEVIVVDDGSTENVAEHLASVDRPALFRTLRTEGVGPGAARHQGAMMATGEILVIVDDDMQVPSGFLGAHFRCHCQHQESVVVLGNILPSQDLQTMPLFERYHARQLDRFQSAAAEGRLPLSGSQLCTGNVSMRRADYFRVGGFDASLERSEDRELGVRMERAGCRFVFGTDAVSIHASDHTDIEVWLRRAYLYGRFDTKIARMHRDSEHAHPWRFWSLIHPLSRPLIAAAMALPAFGRAAARASYRLAMLTDRAGFEGPAVTLTALTFGLQYFRGLREECGSLMDTRAEIGTYLTLAGSPA